MLDVSEKCVDCGRKTSRGLRYCNVCRKAHFTSALRSIRHIQTEPDNTIKLPVTTHHEKAILELDSKVKDGLH